MIIIIEVMAYLFTMSVFFPIKVTNNQNKGFLKNSIDM